MPYMEAEKYRERERQWRGEANSNPEGAERDACIALAEGYATLLAITERLNRSGSGSVDAR
jgi:hypothetical protein